MVKKDSDRSAKKPSKPSRPIKPKLGAEHVFSEYNGYPNYGTRMTAENKRKFIGHIKDELKSDKTHSVVSIKDIAPLFLDNNSKFDLNIDLDKMAFTLVVKDSGYSDKLTVYQDKMRQYLNQEKQYQEDMITYERNQAQKRVDSASREIERINRDLESTRNNNKEEGDSW